MTRPLFCLLPLFATTAFAAAPTKPSKPSSKPAQVTVLFGGDVTLGFHHEEWFDEQVKKGVPRDEMMAWGFREVLPALPPNDLFVVNLECPFTERGEKIPKNFNFRARPEFVGSLLAGGVDVVSLANNHAVDYGVEGLTDTVSTLDQAKIPWFGAGMNLASARTPRIVERNGLKIAFLGYFFLGDRNIEPAEVIATETTPGVAEHGSDVAVMEKMVKEDIALAKGSADLVIPFFHWGREGQGTPEPYQVQLAHAAVDAGAAAVIGSHPHVLQGMELYQGVPVLYSLGNFVFGGNWNPKNKQSALVALTFSSGGFVKSRVVPLLTDRYPEKPVQPWPVEGAQADAVFETLRKNSAGFGQMLPALKGAGARPAPKPDAGTPTLDAGTP